jgi:predicted TIM-barrel fold metal-dependent hydrolase
MECFGSHRIIFGSSSPHDAATKASLVPPERWFSVAKTVVSELVCGSGDLAEAQAEMDAVFFGNASQIWGVGK